MAFLRPIARFCAPSSMPDRKKFGKAYIFRGKTDSLVIRSFKFPEDLRGGRPVVKVCQAMKSSSLPRSWIDRAIEICDQVLGLRPKKTPPTHYCVKLPAKSGRH